MAKTIWDYIHEACTQCNMGIRSDIPPFTGNQDIESSLIDAGDRNRVLLFPGAFNPAHEGHLQLLESILTATKKTLSIRGVVIVPHDDEQVQDKTMEEPATLDLAKSQRSTLWRRAVGFPENKAWIFTGSRSALAMFQEQLQDNLRKENISLTFLLLVGADWISTRAIYDPGEWNCSEAITSDVSRPVDFRCEYTLRQMPGCFEWVQVVFGEDTDDLSRGSLQLTCRPNVMEGVSLWSALTVRRPLRRYYFVPCRRPCSPDTPYPSSTRIRQRIFEARAARLPVDEDVLATALSQDILLGYVRGSVDSLDGDGERAEDEDAGNDDDATRHCQVVIRSSL
ncbi:Rossmann-like alpha/beta/alpha sandwich fold protein [Metarhizium album ARSEF 1941]|uniref:Rossmann-like alpha/beta/alpha sandwich fold protein n=1 Tax=Metarhizium album (strain ARSEF 1941) TaxID=1081103 RepID=A0A0B2WUR4_METAS|nr:Rossmann-like alpha/beta/alpha sandwich fold protein [Metarhizium album ARSEF 1941]KHN96695.1 Rossmann-like alpha/beta/alpha sandwich fold protein [Metarhizium album ARSEF 1941]